MKKEENSRRTERNVKRIRRCLVSWIQRKTGYVLVPLLFPKIIRNLYVTSRVIYEKVSPLLSSFGKEILMLTRTMSRSVETILRISSYLRIFILHPSPKKEEEEGKKESIHAKHSSNCAKMRTVRSINDSFDSKSEHLYRADDKDDPIFSRSGSLSSSLLEEKFPMRRTRSRANISFMQNRFNAHSGGVSRRPTTMTTK